MYDTVRTGSIGAESSWNLKTAKKELERRTQSSGTGWKPLEFI